MQKDTETNPSPSAPGRAYELRDVNIKFAAGIVVGMLLLTVAGLMVSWGVFDFMAARQRASEPVVSPLTETLPQEPPEPRLQVAPALDLEAVRSAEEKVLNSYGWIDQKGGIARIPVARAMERIVEQGLPVRPQAEQTAGSASKDQKGK